MIETLVERWVGQLWNRWEESALPELAHPDVILRGLLGVERAGYAGVWAAMGQVHAAVPDFQTEVVSLLCGGEQALATCAARARSEGCSWASSPRGAPSAGSAWVASRPAAGS